MPDTDKLLEAEQSIQSIASELKRMRDAANLLEGAQEKTSAILNSAERIVRVTEEFSLACGDIVKRLSATDLNRRLDAVRNDLKQMSDHVDQQIQHAADAIATGEAKLARLEDRLQAVAKESKKRHMITTVLIILTLATAFAAFITTLFPGIGG